MLLISTLYLFFFLSSKFLRPPSDVASTASCTSSWDFSSRTTEERPTHRQAPRPGVSSSGGWRKKTATETSTTASSSVVKGEEPKNKGQVLSSESEESENSEEESVHLAQKEPTLPTKIITESDLNALGAKIMRAELMGNEVSW